MQEDPIFKKRFGISTTIRYQPDVSVDPKSVAQYQRAWKRFCRLHEPDGGKWRRMRFDRFLKRIATLGDDLPYTKRVAIRYVSPKVGYGVFAKESIPPYSLLNHYAGILRHDKLIDVDNDSAFMFTEFKNYTIDGMDQGNWCRFMNHSGEGEKLTNVVAWEHYSEYGPRIIFTAGRKGIKKGAQLLYSYGDSYWEEGSFLTFS